MKKIATLFSLFFINAASAQQINNSNINIIGSYQNILITQSGIGHTVNITAIGNYIPILVNQSGNINRTFNLVIECYSNCANNPTIVNQY